MRSSTSGSSSTDNMPGGVGRLGSFSFAQQGVGVRRPMQHNQQQQNQQQQQQQQLQRTSQSSQLQGLGGLCPSLRALEGFKGGGSGMTFDHVLNRLQGELTKTRDTGSELRNVGEALGGSLVSFSPSFRSSFRSVLASVLASPLLHRRASPLLLNIRIRVDHYYCRYYRYHLSHNQITNENCFYHIAIKLPTPPILSAPRPPSSSSSPSSGSGTRSSSANGSPSPAARHAVLAYAARRQGVCAGGCGG
jgi:hypothetical protein